jgi:thiaminase/transcriptional activator TenA
MGELVTLSTVLWHDNADLAAAAVDHPFIRGLANGSLPAARFEGFIAQDAFFLEAFARAYALALAHCPDRSDLATFADLLAGVRNELTLHAAYAGRLGIDLAQTRPTPATLTYTEFLLATAATGGTGLTCAAMTPCMRLYANIGQSLSPRDPTRAPPRPLRDRR